MHSSSRVTRRGARAGVAESLELARVFLEVIAGAKQFSACAEELVQEKAQVANMLAGEDHVLLVWGISCGIGIVCDRFRVPRGPKLEIVLEPASVGPPTRFGDMISEGIKVLDSSTCPSQVPQGLAFCGVMSI